MQTDRETKIVLIKYIIHGVSPYDTAPIETRIKMLKAAAAQFGLDYNEEEWMKLGQEILATQQQVNYNAAKFLQENKDLYKTALDNIHRGNDALISVVDAVLEKGLKKLGLKKQNE